MKNMFLSGSKMKNTSKTWSIFKIQSNHQRIQLTWENDDDVSLEKDTDADTKDEEDKATDKGPINLQHLIIGDPLIQGNKEVKELKLYH